MGTGSSPPTEGRIASVTPAAESKIGAVRSRRAPTVSPVGDLAHDTDVVGSRRSLYGDGERRLGDLGSDGRLRRRGRASAPRPRKRRRASNRRASPVSSSRPRASKRSTSMSPSGARRAERRDRRAHRAGRHRHPRCAGVVRDTERRRAPRLRESAPRTDTPTTTPPISAYTDERARALPFGTTSTSSRSTGSRTWDAFPGERSRVGASGLKFVPTPAFADPVLEAARLLLARGSAVVPGGRPRASAPARRSSRPVSISRCSSTGSMSSASGSSYVACRRSPNAA